METLEQLYHKHKKGDWPDKGSVHSYIEVYEELLKPYRETAKNVLEIGLMSGESLRMWTDYFHGTVYGMDLNDKPLNGLADLGKCIADGYNVKFGDAANPAAIHNLFEGIKFDVIIEDANHDIEQQLNIFIALQPYLAKGGIYIIEDIQDIDKVMYIFRSWEPFWEVLDRRHIKKRYDDVLAIYRNPSNK